MGIFVIIRLETVVVPSNFGKDKNRNIKNVVPYFVWM
jgi:hypothetical protein